MKYAAAVLAVLLLSACSEDYPDRHLSRCLMEWHAASENTKGDWLGGQTVFIQECMSEADFVLKEAPPGRYCSSRDAAPIWASCYVSRQSWNYRAKHLFKDSP